MLTNTLEVVKFATEASLVAQSQYVRHLLRQVSLRVSARICMVVNKQLIISLPLGVRNLGYLFYLCKK